jgi:hypothetical protein
MNTLLILTVAVLAVTAVAVFVTTSPARLAAGIRLGGPVVLGLAALALLLIGRASLAGLLLAGAFAWYGAARMGKPAKPLQNKRSTVRTAALEMELDHESGGLEGLVLAGRHEGKMLGRMQLPALMELYRDLFDDGESRQLLETYLDGRFPAWRDDLKANARNRKGAAPRPGAMTEQEAYQILGLQAGATAAEIRQAHRRLMQRVHPDLGGSSFLAARINEAKDVLLSAHE